MNVATAAFLLYGLTALGLVLLIPNVTVSVVLGILAILNMIWAPALIAIGWGDSGVLPIAICLALLLIAAIARRVTADTVATPCEAKSPSNADPTGGPSLGG